MVGHYFCFIKFIAAMATLFNPPGTYLTIGTATKGCSFNANFAKNGLRA
jgi:hypothetical protein